MDKSYESKRHRLEEDYWLFRARRDIIFRVIQKVGGGLESRILDVGCAGGHLIKFLGESGFKEVYGIDISREAINLCKERGLKKVSVGDCLETKYKDSTFDIVTADNVLEHLADDQKALNEWHRILKTSGVLIVLAPAFKFLWSHHDETCHHYRRYSKQSLTKLLGKSGFEVERSSYWNLTSFFPKILLKGSQKPDQLYKLNPLMNKTLTHLLKLENQFLMRLTFPIGASILAVAKK